MGKDFTVTVDNPKRMDDWVSMFDTVTVHVTSPIPVEAFLPGFDEPQLIYELDLGLITKQQRQKLVRYLSQKFNIPMAEIDRQIDSHGVPILAADCMVTVHNPHKWLV